ncbi:hypothetical protein DICPUDRAFT_94048 [Dictyostelium purpureum]|uniref:Uncharacterized protein n=1 Tax=Dictyostelium purpureum TaxID=5786 RepID=F0ZEQ0_DICPU|nr:uncharacterized protein DICPUDRAFT_94048 [Dictyostelium purpureum]EGC37566.1 hypothetical protein DICPUDRAFT_94048 [Dictyostelium purpureum]|eukprot:XP_003285892.1 hypothetical protein DICPUDRAFT_94048 [Dictyostelium purpureum]
MVLSKYYLCDVYHSRINPVKHTFSYSVFYFIIDLDELENGTLDNYLFGYNKKRVITVNNTDYMGKENRPIKEKLIERFKIHQMNQPSDKDKVDIDAIKAVKLITNPRYFNYSFNPVNFYYCYDENMNLLQVVAEINNTFGETHLYFPTPTEFRDENLKYPFKNSIGEQPFLKRFSIAKDFHVSPFNSLDGAYDFYFCDLEKCFDIRINLMSSLNSPSLNITKPCEPNKENKSIYDYILMTRLWSTQQPFELSSINILKLLLRYPIAAFKTVPRILYEAGRLHWGKSLKIYAKPNPPLENTTILIKPSANELAAYNFFLDYVKQFKNINIELYLPDSTEFIQINTCDSDTGEPIKISIKNYEFFWKLFLFNKITSSSQPSTPLKAFSSKAIGLAYIIWNDISEFINIENIYSFFLFNHKNQIKNQYTFNSNNNFKEIIEKLNINNNTGEIRILEIGCNLSYYLINENYLDNNSNIKLTILIESKELYQYHLSNLNNKYSNVQFINMELSNFIENFKGENKFDTIISMDSNCNNLNDFNQYLNYYKSISKINSIIFIQNINKQGDNSDKPARKSSFKNNYCKLIDHIGRKYWALMAKFQHNPFYLEERYIDLMNILKKSSINCHINDDSDLNDNIASNESFKNYLSNQQDSNEFKLKSFETIDNSDIIKIIEGWIQDANQNQSMFLIKLQEMAMRHGCLLKMNQVEIDEIYRAVTFHLNLILSTFKNNNLIISNFIIENK